MATIGSKKKPVAKTTTTENLLAKAAGMVKHDKPAATEATTAAKAAEAPAPKKTTGKPSMKDFVTGNVEKSTKTATDDGTMTAFMARAASAKKTAKKPIIAMMKKP